MDLFSEWCAAAATETKIVNSKDDHAVMDTTYRFEFRIKYVNVNHSNLNKAMKNFSFPSHVIIPDQSKVQLHFEEFSVRNDDFCWLERFVVGPDSVSERRLGAGRKSFVHHDTLQVVLWRSSGGAGVLD